MSMRVQQAIDAYHDLVRAEGKAAIARIELGRLVQQMNSIEVNAYVVDTQQLDEHLAEFEARISKNDLATSTMHQYLGRYLWGGRP